MFVLNREPGAYVKQQTFMRSRVKPRMTVLINDLLKISKLRKEINTDNSKNEKPFRSREGFFQAGMYILKNLINF